jgi:hypothetical protein
VNIGVYVSPWVQSSPLGTTFTPGQTMLLKLASGIVRNNFLLHSEKACLTFSLKIRKSKNANYAITLANYEKTWQPEQNKKCLLPGLPDGIFSNQKSQFG